MSILWCGGEDVDFPNGVITVNTANTSNYRSTYCRGSVSSSSSAAPARSNAFPGGAVTSCWITWRWGCGGIAGTSALVGGLCKDATSAAGLYLGTGTAGNVAKLTLYKNDGTTKTALATEPNSTIPNSNMTIRLDMQVINYGASATVNVYINGSFMFTFTGDVTVSGVTSLSSVAVASSSSTGHSMSEVIVATEDTRGFPGLVTLAPNANGTTQNWSTPAFTNVSPTTINDANSTFVNTLAQDNQYNLLDPISGSYNVAAVKVIARAMSTSGATAANIKLGFRNGATTAVAAQHATTTAFAPYEDIFSTDPTTSAAWVAADLTALQINLRSA